MPEIEPIQNEPTRWRVWSGTNDDEAYIVDSDYWDEDRRRRGWGCGCPRFEIKGFECRHIRLVKAEIEKRKAETKV